MTNVKTMIISKNPLLTCPCGPIHGRATTHPGKILLEYMTDRWTPEEFANHIQISEDKIKRMLAGRGRVTFELAQKFSTVFDTSVRFWINLQAIYDLTKVQQKFKKDVVKLKELNLV